MIKYLLSVEIIILGLLLIRFKRMDRKKKPESLIASGNKKMPMDLDEIIREHVLRHLPAKAIRRFTGVCRDWKHHVASPFFAHNQTISFCGLSGFFCISPSGRMEFVSLDPLAYGIPDPSLTSFLPEPIDVRCSSNGLLCCQGRTGYKAYYICNPVTRKWKKLPEPTAEHGPEAAVLIFEPALLNFVAEYKLVCAFHSDLGGLEFEIYSSTEGSWRISSEICFGEHSVVPGSGVYAGGVVYWKISSYGPVAFDVATERATLRYGMTRPFGQVNGKLCSASIVGMKLSISEVNAYMNTMRMGAEKRSRHMKEVDLSVAPSSDFRYETASVVFVGYDTVVMRSGKSLACYDVRTKEFKVISAEVDFTKKMVPYVNSLVEL